MVGRLLPTLFVALVTCCSHHIAHAQAKFRDGDPMATCQGADLSDPADAVCGLKEASLSNKVAYAYIQNMDKKDRVDAELFYLLKLVQCTARAVWNDYNGNSGSGNILFDISQRQCAIEHLRYVRLCVFNNIGKTPTVSDAEKYNNEFEICREVSSRGAWEVSTGRSPMPYHVNDLRPWYVQTMRREAGRPRD